MATIVIAQVELGDYFIGPETEGSWCFSLGDVCDITPELAGMVRDLLGALDASFCTETAAALVRNFGDRYGAEPDIVSVPAHDVESQARLYGGSARALASILRDEDEPYDDFDYSGREWTDALDAQLAALRSAVVAHREACADDDCACRWAVQPSPQPKG